MQDDIASTITERVERFIRHNDLCRSDQRVLVACSGGPDSMALLKIMHELAYRLEIELGVVHVDHRQRSDSAQAVRSVEDFCRSIGIACFTHVLDVRRAPPGSSEADLRSLRFECFRSNASKHGYDRLALGHTSDDQVETVLMRILRGTGTFGLQGIGIKREDFFIRPLMCCTSRELISYLQKHRIRYFIDVSNKDTSFLRNRIRHELLPYIRKWINPSIDNALLRLSKSARRDQDFICNVSIDARPRDEQESVRFAIGELLPLHDALLVRVFINAVQTLNGPGANLEQLHIDRLLDKLRHASGQPWSMDLSDGIRVSSTGSEVRIGLSCQVKECNFSLWVHGPGDYTLPDEQTKLSFRFVDEFNPDEASVNTVFFDGEEVTFPLLVRSVEPGDRMRPWGSKGRRKVARILMDAKISKYIRSRVPLLVLGEQVLWVAGIRRSDVASVKPGSRKIISAELHDASWKNEG